MQEFANMQTNRLLSCAHTARLHVPLETGREINRDQHGTPYGTNAQTNKLLQMMIALNRPYLADGRLTRGMAHYY